MNLPWRAGVASEWNWKEVVAVMNNVLDRHDVIASLLTPEERKRGLNILFVGCPGHGKSSTVNGLFAAIENEYTELCIVRSQETHVTSVFRTYTPLRPIIVDDKIVVNMSPRSQLGHLVINFADSVGLWRNNSDIYHQNLKAALYGVLTRGHKAEQEDSFAYEYVQKEESKQWVDETTTDAMAVILVVEVMSGREVLDSFQEFLSIATSKGIPQSLVVTKVDTVDEEIADNPRTMYFSPVVCEKVNKLSRDLDIPAYRTFPIKNYVNEMEVEPSLSYQYLFMLQFVLSDIEARLRRILDNGPK